MSDPGFVAAAYAIVMGGLALYVVSIARRAQSARRTAQALQAERDRHPAGGVSDPPALVPRHSDPSQ